MAHDPHGPHIHGMPSSARWLIAAGYVTLPALLALAWVMVPRDAGKWGGAAIIAITLMVGLGLSVVMFLIGAAIALESLVRNRGQFRWVDYAILGAGVTPMIALGVGLLLPS